MKPLKITSKRQVTFPAEVCRDLGVREGQAVYLVKRTIEDQSCWVLQTRRPDKENWFGALQSYAGSKKHDIRSIRASIEKGRRRSGT